MAQGSFDSLRYARSLEEAGVPKQQADVMAKALSVFADNLVTREYLDFRLGELEARIDARFAAQETRIEEKLSPIRVKLARHDLMLTAIFIAVVIPLVRDFMA